MVPLHVNDPVRVTEVLIECFISLFPVCVQSQPILKVDEALKLIKD